MMTLYGIPNCGTVKKARLWLSEQGLDYQFHDFKKQGIDAERLGKWINAVGLTRLINRQGTTWRALSDEAKAAAEQTDGAIALMQANPSVIKRPVVVQGDKISVGFTPEAWQAYWTK